MENVLPFRPVIRATVVWNPPPWSSQIATPSPTAKPAGVWTVTCCSPKSPSRARGETAASAFRRIVFPFWPRTVTSERRCSESPMRYSPSPISTMPPPRAGDVIDGRLQRPVIGPDHVGVAATDADGGPLAHLRVHGVGQLTLLHLRGEIIAQGDPAANAEDRHDLGDGPCRGDEQVT